jgi:ribokinase
VVLRRYRVGCGEVEMARIVVVGSSNTDMVVKTDSIPRPGETVIGGDFVTAGGGKGANQATAAARLGADVTFVARVGRDLFGDIAVEAFRQEGMNTDYVTRDETAPSGVALIFVDRHGENVIVVAPGANSCLRPQHVEAARKSIESADALVMQLETPIETVVSAAVVARGSGVKVILNPAPACELPRSLLEMVDILTPNETEAARLAGLDVNDMDPEEAARRLLDLGVGAIVITLGARGGLVVTGDEVIRFPAPKVVAVDTTAAGDAFSGALAVAVAEGTDMKSAVRFAAAAAAVSVTRVGAQPSLPTRAEAVSLIDEPIL